MKKLLTLAAAGNFVRMDANQDGFLSLEKFVTQGGKHPQAKEKRR